jgi:hypothetical protein
MMARRALAYAQASLIAGFTSESLNETAWHSSSGVPTELLLAGAHELSGSVAALGGQTADCIKGPCISL